MKLSTRLVLLVLGCLMPILAAQTYLQLRLGDVKRAQVSALVLRQAESASANLDTVIDSVVQFGTSIVRFPDLTKAGPECGARLASLRQDLPQYRFLAIYKPDGELVCGSMAEPGGSRSDRSRWIPDFAAIRDVQVGPLVSGDGGEMASLPIAIRIPGVAPGLSSYVVLAGVDTDWLTTRLKPALSGDEGPLTAATFVVVDRRGAILARLSDGKDGGWPATSGFGDRGTLRRTNARGHDRDRPVRRRPHCGFCASRGGLDGHGRDRDSGTVKPCLQGRLSGLPRCRAHRRRRGHRLDPRLGGRPTVHLPAHRGTAARGAAVAGRRPQRARQTKQRHH